MTVVSLPDAKAHLNITGESHDGELMRMLEACEAAIAEKCGPLESVARTERVMGGGCGLVLRETPVVSITSITPVNGTAYDVSLFTLDESAGVIEWTSGARFTPGRYDVVYQAGRATLPGDLKLGVLELLRHQWDTQRGGARRPGSTMSDGYSNTLPGAAHSFPFRVVELITPHVQVGN